MSELLRTVGNVTRDILMPLILPEEEGVARGLGKMVGTLHPRERLVRSGTALTRHVPRPLTVDNPYATHSKSVLPFLHMNLRGPDHPSGLRKFFLPEESFSLSKDSFRYSKRIAVAEEMPEFKKIVSDLRRISPKFKATQFQVRAIKHFSSPPPLAVTLHHADTIVLNFFEDATLTKRDVLYHEAVHILQSKNALPLTPHLGNHGPSFEKLHNMIYMESRRLGITTQQETMDAVVRNRMVEYGQLSREESDHLRLWPTVGTADEIF